MLDINAHVSNIENEDEVRAYLKKIIQKEAYDGTGLIYGLGHAVYTKSDPRSIILKEKAKELANEKGKMNLFNLYDIVERNGVELLKESKGAHLDICSNVDLFSGLVYQLLDIPPELYTPLFAVARIAGWCAHRIEQVMSDNKIIRPAYICVSEQQRYKKFSER